MSKRDRYIRWFDEIGKEDLPVVGGKNASLGEMISHLAAAKVKVPSGFALTTDAYRMLLEKQGLEEFVFAELDRYHRGRQDLIETGRNIRLRFKASALPDELTMRIFEAYQELGRRHGREHLSVAVRSSATAEDLPTASFAGQQETYLNVTNAHDLLNACLDCFASLFTDRSIAYREERNFDHAKVALSVGVQKMVRSDLAGSGVIFSLDTETGFDQVVMITATWGLGENIVQGTVNPDEYYVFKPPLNDHRYRPILRKKLGEKENKMVFATGEKGHTRTIPTSAEERNTPVLTDSEILHLTRWTVLIEQHFKNPMDIEWAKDGESGELYIVQARPETVQSRRKRGSLKTYRLVGQGNIVVTGRSVGQSIVAAEVCKIRSPSEIGLFKEGSILVTEMTDPDWVPSMKKAVGIVTDHGGRTCHAAIVSRELGIPAVVGTSTATEVLEDDQEVTLSCAEGDIGNVYEGKQEFEVEEVSYSDLPQTTTKIMMNIASPDAAYRWWELPNDGVGLARIEFIINDVVRAHPMALVKYDQLQDRKAKAQIDKLTRGYSDRCHFFVDKLAEGVAMIASAFYPNPVIVRMSDFKSNEYANLIGGDQFEPKEENPMLGFRGASRYCDDRYREGFALECKAMKRVREEIGLTNVKLMVPFCRTIEEADRVLQVMAEHGLVRGEEGLEIYVMAEIPSNVILADHFADRFDGFSIGSNDLTQLTLGIDRDSGILVESFDEQNESVKRMIRMLLKTAKEKGRKVGICGQAPSDYPDFAEFLVREGIDSLSLNPDSIVDVRRRVASVEQEIASGQKAGD
ncbi:MAG: phosphoenolpyruvate synthase [Deltaproteobacteria bacterium]